MSSLKSDRGNAVLGAALNLGLLTLIFASVLAIIFSGYNLLLVREAAISASRFGALVDSSPGEAENYALRLLDESMPLLAQYRVNSRLDSGQILTVEVWATLPTLGLLGNLVEVRAVAKAAVEKVS